MNTGIVIWIGIFAVIAIYIICSTIESVMTYKNYNDRECYIKALEMDKEIFEEGEKNE